MNLKYNIVQIIVLFNSIVLSAQCSPWGISAHPLRKMEWANIDRALSLTNQANISWLREDFQFGRMYRKNAPFDFSAYDKLLEKADMYGVHILPILQAYDSELLKSASELVPIYEHPEEWRRFVRETVSHFHHRMKYWEIWNEPDGGFWKPYPDASQYVKLLQIAYEEIKRIDADCQVLLGGLCYWNADYLEAMYKAGVQGYFDVIAIHSYNYAMDVNAKMEREKNEFYNVISKYESSDKPIWITEFGGSSHKSELMEQAPDFMLKAIQYSLNKLGKTFSSGNMTVGIAVSPRVKELNEIDLYRKWLPGVTLTIIPYNELDCLNPDDVPVLVGCEGLKIDEPLLNPLYTYVQKGGLLIGHGKVPFHTVFTQDVAGNWLFKDVGTKLYPQWGMTFNAHWSKKGIPVYTNEVLTARDAVRAGLPEVSNTYVDRFLSFDTPKEGGHYYPLIHAMHEGQIVGEGMALYTFNNHRGGILLSTICLEAGITEQEQANLLQRNCLLYLSLGIEKLFWYDLHNDGSLKGEKEDNFGLLTYDWQLKPAYNAYVELTTQLGRNPTFIKRLEGDNPNVWALVFQREEDNNKVVAIWSTRKMDCITIQENDLCTTVKLVDNKVNFLPFSKGESIKF